jgi:cytochrome c-type biogenesis protein CcmH
MTAFALAAAALAALTIALLVVPLLRARKDRGATQAEASVAVLRDRLAELEREREAGILAGDAYEAAQRSLKQRILEDSAPDPAPADRARLAPALVLAIAMPVAAIALYAWLGSPEALDPQRAASPHPDAANIEAMVEKLAERLRASPDDPEGWTMLARSYRALGRHDAAAEAFAKAEKRVAPDARLLTDWAESAALAAGGRLAGKPAELVGRALAIDPDYTHALALAGAAAFEREDWKNAVLHWERLASKFAPGSEESDTVSRSLAAAREQLGAREAVSEKRVSDQRVSGRISLAPALAGKAAPADTVFIFARAASGGGAPLAVLRKQVKDLPAEFTLDDSMAMSPQARLSGATEVVVGARVARSGSATPQSGDLQGLSRPVRVGAAGVAVVIDTAIP